MWINGLRVIKYNQNYAVLATILVMMFGGIFTLCFDKKSFFLAYTDAYGIISIWSFQNYGFIYKYFIVYDLGE